MCQRTQKVDLLRLMVEGRSLNKDPSFLFVLAPNILNAKYQQILLDILKRERPRKQTLAVLDDDGFSPFLAFVREFAC